MRIWSLHPKYLDCKGIVALWREALLCQKVLKGETKGYTKHPQLNRFRKVASSTESTATTTTTTTESPLSVELSAISSYLTHVHAEATERNYKFDVSKIAISSARWERVIPVTMGQVQYEMKHLLHKLRIRDPKRFSDMVIVGIPQHASTEQNTTSNIDDNVDEDVDENGDDAVTMSLERAQMLIDHYIEFNEIQVHPLFQIVEGDVEDWEKVESFSGSPTAANSQSSAASPASKQQQRKSGRRTRQQPEPLEEADDRKEDDTTTTTRTTRRRRARKEETCEATSPSKKQKKS